MEADGDTERPNRIQYDLSFEPSQGFIAKKDDFPFLPDASSEVPKPR